MRAIFSTALAVGLLVASAAMADDISTSDAKEIVQNLLVRSGLPNWMVDSAERQGSMITVHTRAKDGVVIHDFRVDAHTGVVKGYENDKTMMGAQQPPHTDG